MGFIARIKRAWKLMKTSWGVVMSEKKLMLYPVVTLVVSLIVLASFIVPLFFWMPVENIYLLLAYLFLLYLVLSFVGILFNASIVGYAAEKFKGRQPDFGDGLDLALSRWPKLLGWSILSAIVGMLIRILKRALRKKFGFLGSLIGGILGVGWTYATFFVLPVLLMEEEGVFSSIKKSAFLFKDTWGETVAGRIGFGLIFTGLGLLGVLAFIGALMTGAPFLVAFVLLVIYLLVIFALHSAMKSVFVTALYQFATEGTLPGPYSRDLFPDAQSSAVGGGAQTQKSESAAPSQPSNQSGVLEDMEGVDVMQPGNRGTSKQRGSRTQTQKTSPSSEKDSRYCPDCGEELRYFEESGRWYCDNCYQYK
ncbi:MAG: TFIIB-type zinc finger domain-containing protein [Candidatus Thermoplasmatota archaeon]|nr:TFIIB-type zinc finger domain-containing protein [Candidatus Thermoplasmatota archaeon]